MGYALILTLKKKGPIEKKTIFERMDYSQEMK